MKIQLAACNSGFETEGRTDQLTQRCLESRVSFAFECLPLKENALNVTVERAVKAIWMLVIWQMNYGVIKVIWRFDGGHVAVF